MRCFRRSDVKTGGNEPESTPLWARPRPGARLHLAELPRSPRKQAPALPAATGAATDARPAENPGEWSRLLRVVTLW